MLRPFLPYTFAKQSEIMKFHHAYDNKMCLQRSRVHTEFLLAKLNSPLAFLPIRSIDSTPKLHAWNKMVPIYVTFLLALSLYMISGLDQWNFPEARELPVV